MTETLVTTPEEERILSLKKYDILDTPPDGSFDRITRLAARMFNVPVAIVSLVDTDRIWFKSKYGINVEQINRELGLCASAILTDELYLVENALEDPRTLANPLVAGEFGLRFYAAVPLRVRTGHNLGTLCIIDKEPRAMSEKEKELFEELGNVLIDELEMRLEARTAHFQQSQMLSMAAHELKNPLTLIPAYASLIKEEEGVSDKVVQMANHIHKAGLRMNTLITEMLESARLQANQVKLKYKDFDMASVVNRVAALNLAIAASKSQHLYVETEEVIIRGDEIRVSEIADNLINNAIKYSPHGASITVHLKSNGENAILEVEDQGPGLTETDKKSLFLPFTRLSARPTGNETSTGLGLSIVKLLVDAHAGRVWTEDNEEVGTRFIVELPALNLQ